MSIKPGDHVIYRHFYKHPGLSGYQHCEALGKVLEDKFDRWLLWSYIETERRLVIKNLVLREASPLEVFTFQVNRR